LFNYRIISFPRQNVSLSAKLDWLQTSSLWVYRVLTWAIFGTVMLCAATVLTLRYWVLPNIEQYREDIAQAVSRAVKQRITIGGISANWDGMRPQLMLENVTVYDAANRSALQLSRVDNTLSWLSLLRLDLRFHSISLYQPALNIKRDKDGMLWVAGIGISAQSQEGGGVADWLLRQREIVITDATVNWLDEFRAAPPLELKSVKLQLVNHGARHRFGLYAVPPQEYASPLDIRGDLSGQSFKALANWNGKFFLRIDYVDIAAWRTWVTYPIEFPRGAGGLRMWLGFSQNVLRELTADVRLSDVRTRLAKDLPELDLEQLSGRIAWKSSAAGFEITTAKLGLTAQGGLTLQPVDFFLRLNKGGEKTPERGEMRANSLDLQPLAALADRLPLGAELRKQLAELSPRGSLHDVALRWGGDWQAPGQYSARARFQNLVMNRYGRIPAISGVSGNVDGNEKAGSLYVDAGNVKIDMPLVFRDPLELEKLNAHVEWAQRSTDTELIFKNMSFSNPHLAGSLSGSYRLSADSKGLIDLNGSLTRADARHIGRYLPLIISKNTRDWVDRAILSGKSNDVSLRLKGNLEDFPFPDDKGGVFQVTAKVDGGVLNYAEGWPGIENISGDVSFRGKRLDIDVRNANILGAQLGKVHAEIADLKFTDELLVVTGDADGPTSEFLGFIEKSPVSGMINRFTDGIRAQGNGALALKLQLPLRTLDKSSVSGTYRFINNTIVGDPDLPPFEQANGTLEFTEDSVHLQNVKGVFLGGPVTISATTQHDATVRINLQGRANVDNLRRAGGAAPWMLRLRGATDWRGTFLLRKKQADLVVETELQGIASDLPPPFAKTAGEAVPLRYERKYTGPQQEQILFSYGERVSANLQRRLEGARSVVQRGQIRFGGAAAEPERDGVMVSGSLRSLDLDRWMALGEQNTEGMKMELSGVDLKVGTLTTHGRNFNEISINGSQREGIWHASLAGREMEGSASWQPQGRGKLTARFRKLVIPPALGTTVPGAVQSQNAAGKPPELPALDVIADQFQFKDKQLGKLELNAVPEERNWRIDKLHISNAEGTFSGNGVWKAGLNQPHTQMSLRLETSDIGKLLTRLGYPDSVQGGNARMEGELTWSGAPQEFDYSTLSGTLALQARKGQFLRLKPGFGKLLGIMSLQSLPRRITLDFRDIFSDGLVFDEIVGAANISRGIALTEGFHIQSPSARVLMSGEVDLSGETQKLRVRITPGLSDGVSIAGALLGGPVAGIAAFLAQKILKDPLDWIASYEYNVTGTWADPQVSKIERSDASVKSKPQ
jgi:uncharacterized protein (TIGR02099 family)